MILSRMLIEAPLGVVLIARWQANGWGKRMFPGEVRPAGTAIRQKLHRPARDGMKSQPLRGNNTPSRATPL
ncbi:hypothetical protein [Faunimonas pinastri]|uniref:hypothetical protein n=1 Tax=Faunimonas pinastri TaxID=1855383 RepID=UPI0015A5B9C2|nr:hypothetical protein [Faunimonas pinastri]